MTCTVRTFINRTDMKINIATHFTCVKWHFQMKRIFNEKITLVMTLFYSWSGSEDGCLLLIVKNQLPTETSRAPIVWNLNSTALYGWSWGRQGKFIYIAHLIHSGNSNIKWSEIDINNNNKNNHKNKTKFYKKKSIINKFKTVKNRKWLYILQSVWT